MKSTVNEVLEFVKENDVKFVRLNFCDLFGVQKNISIMACELQSAFENGVSFDAHLIRGFRDITKSDLFLFPDPTTLAVLPWRPGPGRVVRFYCDIKNPDGSIYADHGREVLKRVADRALKMNYTCKIGAECEFYLFKTGDNGEPSTVTLDKGGYLDISPLDKGEDIRREICLTLEEMGIQPEVSHHEQGPGQNEIDFRFNDVLISADNMQTFKTVVKAIASRNGLFASFMPKPLPSAPGSGMHIYLSLSRNGQNIFKNAGEGQSSAADNFIAGVLEKTPEISLFLNPIANSYERLGKFDAPKYVSWSYQNRSQLIRIPAAEGEKVRMELRSPDPSLNPYLGFALIIAAGLDGIEKKAVLPPAVDADLYTADKNVTKDLPLLPDSLDKAIALAEKSGFVKSVIGEELFLKYLDLTKIEAGDFSAAKEKGEFFRDRYFGVI
uniref:Glutamine synthetase type I n=1 Tax=uncultured bacterium contig00003 TaxID=1181495 RepID=A0A806KBI0_9BACT|nr:glutamine synthetase type I [uncultured bacterium contig00003]